jgi:signal transduction histidine kinase
VRIGKVAGPFALKIEEMTTAYTLYIDGKPLGSSGRIGRSFDEMTPEFLPKTVYFLPESDTIDIVFHVSNFWNNRGGLWKNIYIGTQAKVIAYDQVKKGFDYFVTGALLIIFIYHLILFFLERRNWSALFFGIFCFLMAARALLNDERIIYDFISYMGWSIAQRLELLTTYIGVPVFVIFFRSLYPDEVNKIIAFVFVGAGIVWSIVTLIIPPTLISFSFDVFQWVLFAACAFVLYGLVRAIMAQRYGSILFAIGITILVVAIVNDILYSQFIIYTAFLTPFGLVIGIFFAEVALNVKFVRTEQAFQKSEEKSRAILSATPDSMLQVLKDGTIADHRIKSDMSPVFVTSPSEGMHVSEAFDADITKSILDTAAGISDSEKPRVFVHSIPVSDKRFHCEVRIAGSGEGKILVILRDITAKIEAEEELRLQQEQLVHADKLVALGTLTAGVAHEINNPNNAILLASQANDEAFSKIVPVLKEAFEANSVEIAGGFTFDEIAQSIGESSARITRNSRRIKQIVEDLKSFAGKDSGIFDQEVELGSVVESAIRLLENPIRKSTRRFSLFLAKGLPRVRGNAQRLEQVVINIVQNACYALSDPDKAIRVKTGSGDGRNEVFVEVDDEGVGMDENTKRRIFDPFFTTRRGAGGTGLGMPISARIVKDHKGRIEIVSEKGKGTRMRIILPAIKRE